MLAPSRRDQRPSAPEVGIRRLEAFSDAIFAIATTLLALNLHVPEMTTINPRSLAAALGLQWPTYLAFVLSFVTVLIAWVYHHRLLQIATRAETRLLFANGAVLLFVSAVPFPTALLGSYLTTAAASVACAIYASYIAGLNLTYNVVWWVVVRQHHKSRLNGRRPPTNMILSYLGLPLYLIAVGIAFWTPVATLVICGALWVVWAIRAPEPAVMRQGDSPN